MRTKTRRAAQQGVPKAQHASGTWHCPAAWLVLMATYVGVLVEYDTLGNMAQQLERLASAKLTVWYAGNTAPRARVAQAAPVPHGAASGALDADVGAPVERAATGAGNDVGAGVRRAASHPDGAVLAALARRAASSAAGVAVIDGGADKIHVATIGTRYEDVGRIQKISNWSESNATASVPRQALNALVLVAFVDEGLRFPEGSAFVDGRKRKHHMTPWLSTAVPRGRLDNGAMPPLRSMTSLVEAPSAASNGLLNGFANGSVGSNPGGNSNGNPNGISNGNPGGYLNGNPLPTPIVMQMVNLMGNGNELDAGAPIPTVSVGSTAGAPLNPNAPVTSPTLSNGPIAVLPNSASDRSGVQKVAPVASHGVSPPVATAPLNTNVVRSNAVAVIVGQTVGTMTRPVAAPRDTGIYTSQGSTLALSAQMANAALLNRLSQRQSSSVGQSQVWSAATGVQTKLDPGTDAGGFEAHQYDLMVGLDHPLDHGTIGIAGGYSHADIQQSNSDGSGSTDTLRAALYGSRWFGPVGLSASVGYGVDFLSQKRRFGPAGTAQGDHVGQQFTAAGQASLPVTLGATTLTPRIGVRYAYVHSNGFGERGASSDDLSVGADNVRSLQPYVMMTLDRDFGSVIKPTHIQLRVGYAQELLDTSRAVSVDTPDGTAFSAPGTLLPRGQLTAGFGVSVHPSRALTLSLSYDALIDSGRALTQAADVHIDYRF